MTVVRRHLRRGVAAWLVCHALMFTALLPRDCCAAHTHGASGAAAEGEVPCHESGDAAPVPGTHCEMAAEDGAACPMHAAPASSPDCAMTGSCQAPAAALAAVLLQAAELEPGLSVAPHLSPLTAARPTDVSARSLATPPAAPPPRA